MTIRVAIRGNKERAEAEVEPFFIRMKEGVFAVTTPMFDDWMQTVNYDLRAADAIVDADVNGLILEFPDESGRKAFIAWLSEANAKAEHGYRTMWG